MNTAILRKNFRKDIISFCDAGFYCTNRSGQPVPLTSVGEYLLCRRCFIKAKREFEALLHHELISQMD